MNRHQRRAAASQRGIGDRFRVERYRVPPGRVALTFDLGGRPPSTISIRAGALTDVVDRFGALVADKTYQQVLHLLMAVIKEADAGNAGAWNSTIIGFWLALNHPAAGAEMAGRLADAIALDGRAHLTMHASHDRGIAFALCDRFVDLDQAAASAREAGVATYVAAEPRRHRPGGLA